MLDISRHIDAILLIGLNKSLLAKFHLQDDPVVFLQNVTHPPVEGGLAINVVADGVLSSLHRATLLPDREFLPGGRTVLPMDTYLPAFCGACLLNLTMIVGELMVGVGVGGQAAPVPDHRVEQQHPVSVLVTHVVY